MKHLRTVILLLLTSVSIIYLGCKTNELEQYVLKVSVVPEVSGEVNIIEGTYDPGEIVQLEAIANTDWIFSEWVGDVQSTKDSIGIVMDNNKNISAIFEELQEITCGDVAQLRIDISEISEDGATFTINTPFKLDNVNSYSIGYGTKGFLKDSLITINEAPIGQNISIRVNDGLINGLEYLVYGNFIIEGQKCSIDEEYYFTSQGSAKFVKWRATLNRANYGFDLAYGLSIDNEPYIMNRNGLFFKINDSQKLVEVPVFPNPGGGSQNTFLAFEVNKKGYFKTKKSNSIYEFDPETDTWEKLESTFNMFVDDKVFGGAIDDKGYIFDKNHIWVFDPQTDNLEIFSNTSLSFISSINISNSIFGISSNFDIYKLNLEDKNWDFITEYPGLKSNRIASFTHENAFYLGFSHQYTSPGKNTNYDLWKFDIELMNWAQVKSFPSKMNFDNSFNIASTSINNKFLFFYEVNPNESFVWSINPEDLVSEE